MCRKRIYDIVDDKNIHTFVVYKIFAHKLEFYGDLGMNVNIGMDE